MASDGSELGICGTAAMVSRCHHYLLIASDSEDAAPIAAFSHAVLAHATINHTALCIVLCLPAAPSNSSRLRALSDASSGVLILCTDCWRYLESRPPLRRLLALRQSATFSGRRSLLTPANFAAFYAHQLLPRSVRRVLYVDTDVLLRADVAPLLHTELGSSPFAAVEDCSQRLDTYFAFPLDPRLRRCQVDATQAAPDSQKATTQLLPPVQSDTCVFNRGLLLINTRVWGRARLTSMIECFVGAFIASNGTLWRLGASQPPILLAAARSFTRLDMLWNARGLARDFQGRKELQALVAHARSLAPKRLPVRRLVKLRPAQSVGRPSRTHHRPYTHPFADLAYALHFNGELKPWHSSHRREDLAGDSMCAASDRCVVACRRLYALASSHRRVAHEPNMLVADAIRAFVETPEWAKASNASREGMHCA